MSGKLLNASAYAECLRTPGLSALERLPSHELEEMAAAVGTLLDWGHILKLEYFLALKASKLPHADSPPSSGNVKVLRTC